MATLRNRIFVSYSSQDRHEVELLDLELRRRGVPLWRDRTDLGVGRVTDEEIERAAGEAGGFLFYLTEAAARSDWVRERELFLALERKGIRPSLRIVPVFREVRAKVVKRMTKLATKRNRLAQYDLSPFNGYAVDEEMVTRGRIGDELRKAAEAVLKGSVEALAASHPPGTPFRVGLSTRGGLDAYSGDLDLLLDWTADYSKGLPAPDLARCRDVLAPALESFRGTVRRNLSNRCLRVVPACHLSMALAFGFRFRRGEGVSLEVVDANGSHSPWTGPESPEEPRPGWWAAESKELSFRKGADLVLAINLTQEKVKFQRDLETYLKESGPAASKMLYLEPTHGPSSRSMKDLRGDEAHRVALGALEHLSREGHGGKVAIHLFLASPTTFAVLLGQQFSNFPPVQSYEWSVSEATYSPSFRFQSS